EPAWIELPETGLAPNQVQGRAPLRAGLGQRERPRGEVEGGEPDPPWHLVARLSPVKPARDHEVQDEKKVVLEPDHDALAQSTQREDAPPRGRGERRIDGAEEERGGEAGALGTGGGGTRPQRLHVDGDVGGIRPLRRRSSAYTGGQG